jgi:hypothetical protein
MTDYLLSVGVKMRNVFLVLISLVASTHAQAQTWDPIGEGVITSATYVDIEFHGAVIGPCDGGAAWDSMGRCNGSSQDAASYVAALLTGIPAMDVVSGYVTDWAAPPEAVGTAQFRTGSGWSPRLCLGRPDNNSEDSFHPDFPGNPSFRGLELAPHMSVLISLEDEDFNGNDEIGQCLITSAQIENYLYTGQSRVQVDCSSQTANRLLTVEISVYPSQLTQPDYVGSLRR